MSTSSGQSVLRNTLVTLTATVSATGPATGTPAGTVQFLIDNVPGTPVTIDGTGKAVFSTSTLTVGRHTVAVIYSGSGDWLTSTSASITQTIR